MVSISPSGIDFMRGRVTFHATSSFLQAELALADLYLRALRPQNHTYHSMGHELMASGSDSVPESRKSHRLLKRWASQQTRPLERVMPNPGTRLALRAGCLIYGSEKVPECIAKDMTGEQGYTMNLRRVLSGSCIVARGIIVDKSTSVSADELVYDRPGLQSLSSESSLPV